ncbi:MAG: hypothetical protein AAGK93_11225, partial [Pseudomonadota bacterium]
MTQPFKYTDHDPDYEFWRRMAYWTPEEGIALALGMDPRSFNRSVLADSDRADEKVKIFFDWLEFAQRAVEMGRLAEKCDPERFMEWLSALGFAGGNHLIEIDSRTGDFELTTEVQRKLSPIDYRASY